MTLATLTQATATESTVMASAVAEGAKAAASKKENYSDEVTTKLLKAYETEKDVSKLATMFGKTTKSIVAKLSREKVYVKPTYKTKTGEAPISKEEIVSEIATMLNSTEEKLESLTKATKPVLLLLRDALELQSTLLSSDEVEESQNDDGEIFETVATGEPEETTEPQETIEGAAS